MNLVEEKRKRKFQRKQAKNVQTCQENKKS
jgi:hypothetical protein